MFVGWGYVGCEMEAPIDPEGILATLTLTAYPTYNAMYQPPLFTTASAVYSIYLQYHPKHIFFVLVLMTYPPLTLSGMYFNFSIQGSNQTHYSLKI